MTRATIWLKTAGDFNGRRRADGGVGDRRWCGFPIASALQGGSTWQRQATATKTAAALAAMLEHFCYLAWPGRERTGIPLDEQAALHALASAWVNAI